MQRRDDRRGHTLADGHRGHARDARPCSTHCVGVDAFAQVGQQPLKPAEQVGFIAAADGHGAECLRFELCFDKQRYV